jgi:peptidoglycan-associated lipoprotein
MKTAGVLIVSLAVAVSGCQTIRTARDRIVRTSTSCADSTVPIYFAPGQADVPPEGRRLLQAAADQARACRVKSVSVVGLADAAGSPQANLDLSRRRVQAVAATLGALGLPAADFDAAAVGAAGSVTPEGRADPLRRRVEITLRMEPPT